MQVMVIASLMNSSRAQLSGCFSLLSRECDVSNLRDHCGLLHQARSFYRFGDLRAVEGVLGVTIAAGRQNAFLALNLYRRFAIPKAFRPREAPAVGPLLENKTDGFDCPEFSLF